MARTCGLLDATTATAHQTARLCPDRPQHLPTICSKLGSLEVHKLPVHVQNQDLMSVQQQGGLEQFIRPRRSRPCSAGFLLS